MLRVAIMKAGCLCPEWQASRFSLLPLFASGWLDCSSEIQRYQLDYRRHEIADFSCRAACARCGTPGAACFEAAAIAATRGDAGHIRYALPLPESITMALRFIGAKDDICWPIRSRLASADTSPFHVAGDNAFRCRD